RRKVKRVIDGDTFEVYTRVNGSRFIRLAGVNAPERYHSGGRQATMKLKRLIEGKTVTLVPKARSYGRVVGNVRYKRKSVNKRVRK
ncbi:MAG: thermonuclease family protein, partial [Nanoarchaeota archaeon]|nr:thermonuclease family protein [Nanoarchaeota archaeon]